MPSFLPPKLGAMLKFHREDSQVFNPSRPKWSMSYSDDRYLCCFCSKFTRGFRLCPALEPRGLRAGPKAISCHHSPLVLTPWGILSNFILPDVSNFGVHPSKYFSLSLVSSLGDIPKHFSSLWAFINTMLICLSWEQKSFSFLTNPYTYFNLLVDSFTQLFVSSCNERWSAFLCVPVNSKNVLFKISV